MATEKSLNARMKRFCDRYVIHLNGARASREAGYAETRAKQTAADLLGREDVKEYIARLMKRREEESRVKAHVVLEELGLMGVSNIEDYVISDDGKITLSPDAHPDAMRAVSSIKHKIYSQGERITREVEIKLWPKDAAVRMMGQHLAMFKEVHENRDKTLEDMLLGVLPAKTTDAHS